MVDNAKLLNATKKAFALRRKAYLLSDDAMYACLEAEEAAYRYQVADEAADRADHESNMATELMMELWDELA